jgi:hypothetical protein
MWRRHLLQSQPRYCQHRPVPAQHKGIAMSWVMEWGIQHHLAASVGTINTATHQLQREFGEVDSIANPIGAITLFLQSTTVMGKYMTSSWFALQLLIHYWVKNGTSTKNAKHALSVGNGRAIFTAQLAILKIGLGLKLSHIIVDWTHFYVLCMQNVKA